MTARFAILLVALGCGYGVVRTRAPFNMHRMAVVPFAELEAVGVTAELAQALSQELATGGVELVPSRVDAEGVLSGTIQGSATIGSPARDANTTDTFVVRLILSATLVDPAGTSVWSARVSVDESFLKGNDAIATEANRREALRRLATEAAHQLYDQLAIAGAPKV